MSTKVNIGDEIVECDYEPECVVWTDDGGPYTYYTSIDEWKESMLDGDADTVWYGTHNDEAYIDECAKDMRKGLIVHITWYQLDTWCGQYHDTGARFFVTALYINPKTDDWYYPSEVEVIDE